MQIKKYVALMVLALSSIPLAAQEGGVPRLPPPQKPQEAPILPGPIPAEGDYTISRQDILSVVVIDQPSLTNKYTVDADGAIRFPLLNRVTAAGKTLHQLESELKKGLADGFLKDPQVVVSLDQFKGRKVFVWGAAGGGMYPLGDDDTILAMLVKVGAANLSEAVIIRPKSGSRNTKMLSPDTTDGETIHVSMRELEKEVEQGNFSRNLPLQDGDVIFLPRVDKNRVYVTGQVKAPAAYSVPEGTTVLQVIALAGGLTEAASTKNIKIQRIVNNKKVEKKVKLEDVVLPGDTIIVGERFF